MECNVSIDEYDIQAVTGLGEPVELAHLEVESGDQTRYVRVIRNVAQRDWLENGQLESDVLVSECWALEVDETYDNIVMTSHSSVELFHFSTKGHVQWKELADEVRDNAYYMCWDRSDL